MTLLKILLIHYLLTLQVMATAYDPNLPDHGVMSLDYDGFIDPKRNYALNVGRVTDVNLEKKILKIKVENDTTRFLKSGDQVLISFGKLSNKQCETDVVVTEISYLTITWKNLQNCWDTKSYFRRGLTVNLESSIMQLRVQQASAYRVKLLERRNVYLKQLSEVNNFFWQYETDRDKLLNEYDLKINALKNERTKVVSGLDDQRVSKTKMQGELMQELNSIDDLLNFYRIDRKEMLTDRFNQDYDTSAPVNQKARVQQ